MIPASYLQSYLSSFCTLSEEFFLESALHNIDGHEDSDDKVKSGFGHGHNRIAEELEVCLVCPFRDQHHSDNQENKKAEDFIEPVLLQEF